MAVRPDRQRQGVGTAVVRAAVAAADEHGEPLVLVEGIPAYYQRFGFVSATELGLERPDERIPDQAWLALPLGAYDPEHSRPRRLSAVLPGTPECLRARKSRRTARGSSRACSGARSRASASRTTG